MQIVRIVTVILSLIVFSCSDDEPADYNGFDAALDSATSDTDVGGLDASDQELVDGTSDSGLLPDTDAPIDPAVDALLDMVEEPPTDSTMDQVLDPADDFTGDPAFDTLLDTTGEEDGGEPEIRRVNLCAANDWKRVLEIVPLLMHDDNVEPFLALYVDPNGIPDLDSALTFLERYQPDQVRVIDAVPEGVIGHLTSAAGILPTGSTLANVFSAVAGEAVYVEDDYELALMASSYAALTGRRLVIAGGALDQQSLLSGQYLVRVGSVSCPTGATCSELALSLGQMRQAVAQSIDSGAVILAHRDDRTAIHSGSIPTRLSTTVQGLYGSTSLMAPYLAAARQELLITVGSSSIQDIDSELEAAIVTYLPDARYLTIMASPLAIPVDIEVNGDYRFQLDTSVYGSMGLDQVPEANGLFGNDTFPDLYTGRIMGLTLTDVSSTLVNSLFYGEMADGLQSKAYLDDDGGADHININNTFADLYGDSGWTLAYNQDETLTAADLVNATTIQYAGHGNADVAGFINTSRLQTDVSDLFPAVVFLSACLTCRWSESTPPNLLCAWLMRRGATGVVTAVGYGNDEDKVHFMTNLFNRDWTTGQAFVEMRRSIHNTWFFHFMNPYILLGDPLFNPEFAPLDNSYLPLTQIEESRSEGRIDVTFEISEEVDTTAYNLFDLPAMTDYAETATNQHGQPGIFYTFEAIPQGSAPAALEVEYRVSPDWSWSGEYNCSKGVEDGSVFDTDRAVCNAVAVEVCESTDCATASGSQVRGVDFPTAVLIHTWSPSGETYSLTNLSPVFDDTFPFLDDVADDPWRQIEIDLSLTYGHR